MRKFRGLLAGAAFLMCLLFMAAPVSASAVRQTGASGATVDLAWKRQDKAAYYRIYYKSASEKTYRYLKNVKASGENCTASLKLPKEGKIYRIQLTPYDQNGKKGTPIYLTDCRTLPGKLSLRSQKSYATSKSMKLYWNGAESAKGYEFYVTDLSGRLVKRCKAQGKSSVTLTGLAAGEFYRVRIRGYFSVGKKNIYGPASYTYIAQQPRVKFKWASHCVARAYWPDVLGAVNYTVYMSENPSRGFQKVMTVPQAEAYIPGLRRDRKYYVYVTANLRQGKKTYASPKTHYYSFRLQGDES